MNEQNPIDASHVYREVSELTTKTTQLLETVLLLRQSLSSGVSTAEESSQSASTSSQQAQNALSSSQTIRTQVNAVLSDMQSLLADAEAVVHGGDASLNPGAGKLPIGDADGRLKSGWMPEDWGDLHATYSLAIKALHKAMSAEFLLEEHSEWAAESKRLIRGLPAKMETLMDKKIQVLSTRLDEFEKQTLDVQAGIFSLTMRNTTAILQQTT